MERLIARLQETFKKQFRSAPQIYASPGRINLIGEHTDYNDGFVLPGAVDKCIFIAIKPNGTNYINAYASSYNEQVQLSLKNLTVRSGWINYVAGVTAALQQEGLDVPGFDMCVDGNVPLGAGMSSSAALSCCLGFALSDLFALDLTRQQIARIAQWAEHHYAGVQCGIMDQFASLFGKKDHVLLLDCRSLHYRSIPSDLGEYELVLFNTGVQHALAETAYNDRRAACEKVVRALQKIRPEVNALRDATLEDLAQVEKHLTDDVITKAQYVIQENERVQACITYLENGEMQRVGDLLYGSHFGLSNQYEVSCEELDLLVEFTKDKSYVLGARMMGGGFGGCTINLVHRDYMDELINEIKPVYRKKILVDLTHYHVELGDGTRRIE